MKNKEVIHGGIDNDGHYRCFFCDGVVCHNGSDMAIDIYEDSDPDDVLHYMICSRCGAEYEIIQHSGESVTSMGDELKLRKQMLGRDEE